MKWMLFLNLFFLVAVFSLCSLPLPCESPATWDSVVEDLEKVKTLDPVLATTLAIKLQGILGSYDQSIVQRDKEITDRDRRLTEYDKAYVKVNKNLTISYVLLGATGGLAVGGLLWGLVEHFTAR